MDDEIAFHIESRVRELVARGQPEAMARANAEREFGDLRASRRELAAVDRHRRRRERIAQWIDATGQDFRHAARSLRRAPAFTVTAVMTLFIGIGASVTIFAIVNGVLLRPLPYGHPERLVGAWHDMPKIGLMHTEQSVATYAAYRRLAHTIEGIGVYQVRDVNLIDPAGASAPARLTAAFVSATLMPVLEVAPVRGRALAESDDEATAAPVMLISDGMWRSRFAADAGVIGRRLDVNGVSREIIGVMSPRFRFPTAETQVWIPLQLDLANPPAAGFSFYAIARLKSGVTVADAQRDFATVLPRSAELVPKFVPGISSQQILDQVHPQPKLVPLRADITGGIARTLWTVATAALLVLLAAVANVVNLTLVRADARQRELAVREALGAGRARVLLHFFVESAMVAGGAAALGLAGAAAAVRLLVRAAPSGIPRLTEVTIDSRTVVFAVVVAALAATACALLPSMRTRRGAKALREGGRTGTAGRGQHRTRGGLVVAQIALALVVLSGAGLLLRTFQRLNAVRPGFTANGISTLWISLPATRYTSDTSIVVFYRRLVERVAALPGVARVGLTSRLPLERHGIDVNPLYPESDQSFQSKLPPLQLFTTVNEDYLGTMGIPIIAGRGFDRSDENRDAVAIVSQSTARFFWKDSTGVAALGRQFRPLPRGSLYTVIGVAGDTRDTTLAAPPSQVVYFPELLVRNAVSAQAARTMALVVQMTGDGSTVAPATQQILRELDPTLPIFDARPMSAVVSAATAQLSLIILILGSAAAVTMTLGAVGLYGVLAYIVVLRRRETGIRMALGASPGAVAMAMARYGLTLTGVGVVVGMAIFAITARFLRTMLFGVAASDPVAIGGAALLLVVVATAACVGPARRAAQVEPAETLRSE